ncbi:Acyl-CoA Delta(11) desaturase [Gryllus bimaculatus]|nr:Acyl-CoA Delta(11) desaturase [Gryllus bimaculatus]
MDSNGSAENTQTEKSTAENSQRPRREIHWFTTLWHLHLHLFALYALLLVFIQAKFLTVVFAFVLGTFSLLGVTAGSHRLWAHRTYTASLPLKVFLLLCQTASGTGSVYDWVLEHRVHHKHHGTDDDPFNHKRGFLFSHLVSRVATRPSNWEQLSKGVDMSDIEAEPLLMYQKSFSYDTNLVFLVNLSMWPHYHYLLPWDYQTDEYYGSYCRSCTTNLIRAWAAVGWASGLRTVDTAGVRAAVENSARDGTDLITAVEEQGRLYSERIQSEHLIQRPTLIF